MNLSADGLGLPWLMGGLLIWTGLMVWAFKTAPWHKVVGDRSAQHVLLAAAFILLLVWQFGASIGMGFTFHFLLVTTLTLMFGPQFALIGMSLALLGVTFESGLGFLSLGINAILMGAVPILITWWMARWAFNKLDHNFFVFIFFNAFFSAAVGVVVSLSLAASVLFFAEVHSIEVLKQNFVPFIPLMATPEGFLNGMLMTAFILFKPEWVSSFNDETYFK